MRAAIMNPVNPSFSSLLLGTQSIDYIDYYIREIDLCDPD